MICYTVYDDDGSVLQSGTAQSETQVRQVFPNRRIEFGVAHPYVAPPPVLDYAARRRLAYPPIGDQLDALWKGGDAAAEMLARIQSIKTAYPK